MADAPTSSPIDLDEDRPGDSVAARGRGCSRRTGRTGRGEQPRRAGRVRRCRCHLPDPAAADDAAAAQPAPPSLTATAPTSRRVRARLARLGAQRPSTNPVLEPLFRVVRQTHPKADLRMLEQAYEIAEREHRGQVRKSGDPFITHPLAVTTILAELGMTPPTLCAALLHDTVEDTPYTLETLRADFGDEVAHLVDGVTKLDRVTYGESAQAETVRKMVVAMARDIRVLVIKLADRLHNMRTIKYVKPASAERSARETLEIYAPLAHRLGMNTLKWELEDLAFATLYPKVYDEIVRLVSDRSPSRDDYLTGVIEQLDGDLKSAKIRSQVTGRPKHYYSIYQKMIVRGRDFADIYDLVGIRILVDSVRDCYAVLGSIHARWNPVPGRFKDYIAMPKFNMYQSLHTTVIGPEGKPVELQIRTFAMHRRAEYGVAAHWKYKEDPAQSAQVEGSGSRGGKGETSPVLPTTWPGCGSCWTGRRRPRTRASSWRACASTSSRWRSTSSRRRATSSRCRPGRPRSTSPTRCTPRSATGASAPASTAAWCRWRARWRTATLVEVFTSKAQGAGPSRDWLTFVKSPRARNKIRAWFSKERREEAIEQGKEAITKAMRKQNLPIQRLLTTETLTRSPTSSATPTSPRSTPRSATATSRRSPSSNRLVESLGGEEGATEDLAEVVTPGSRRPRARSATDPGVVVKGATDIWVKLARCCTPVPGDGIVGLRDAGERRLGAPVRLRQRGGAAPRSPTGWSRWSGRPSASSVFLVAIQVEALDRSRLLSDVTRVLSDQHVNILSASVTTTRDRVAHVAVHLRDGRPQAPRPRAAGRPAASTACSTSTG